MNKTDELLIGDDFDILGRELPGMDMYMGVLDEAGEIKRRIDMRTIYSMLDELENRVLAIEKWIDGHEEALEVDKSNEL